MEDLRYDRPVAAEQHTATTGRILTSGIKAFTIVPLIAVTLATGGTTQSCGATSPVAPGRVTDRAHRAKSQGTPEAYFLKVTRDGVESPPIWVTHTTYKRCQIRDTYPACANSSGRGIS